MKNTQVRSIRYFFPKGTDLHLRLPTPTLKVERLFFNARPANLSVSVYPKRFSARSLTHKILCVGNLIPRILSIWLAKVRFGKGFWAPLSGSLGACAAVFSCGGVGGFGVCIDPRAQIAHAMTDATL